MIPTLKQIQEETKKEKNSEKFPLLIFVGNLFNFSLVKFGNFKENPCFLLTKKIF